MAQWPYILEIPLKGLCVRKICVHTLKFTLSTFPEFLLATLKHKVLSSVQCPSINLHMLCLQLHRQQGEVQTRCTLLQPTLTSPHTGTLLNPLHINTCSSTNHQYRLTGLGCTQHRPSQTSESQLHTKLHSITIRLFLCHTLFLPEFTFLWEKVSQT